MSGILCYDSNNSGGSWWLRVEDWEALERAGWNVHWGDRVYDKEQMLLPVPREGKTWLGAEAMSAAKKFKNAPEGVKEWEKVTGQNAADQGCNCCGNPHNFEWHDDDGSVAYSSVRVERTSLEWE